MNGKLIVKRLCFFQERRCAGGSSHLMFESPAHVPTKPTNLKTRIAVLKVGQILLILNLLYTNKKSLAANFELTDETCFQTNWHAKLSFFNLFTLKGF